MFFFGLGTKEKQKSETQIENEINFILLGD